MDNPFWHAVENLNISGGEPTTRNDLPEIVELFVKRLPRLRKLGINTTGLTPHRAIPMLTRIVEVLRRARRPDQHPRLARRHRRGPQRSARREARLREGLPDHRGHAGARRGHARLPVRHRLDDLRDQPRPTRPTSSPGPASASSTSSSTCCASPTTCSATAASRSRSVPAARRGIHAALLPRSRQGRERAVAARRSCTCTTPT